MIELFTRKLDAIQLPEDAVLTPLSMDEDISSLSAILLDDDYYEFLKQGKVTVDGVTVLDAAYLIPFKAKAWMDLTDRKAAGEHVDSKNIKKHKNDVFRLTELIDPTAKVVAPQGVYADIQEFVQRMKNENVDIKQLGLVGRKNNCRKVFLPPGDFLVVFLFFFLFLVFKKRDLLEKEREPPPSSRGIIPTGLGGPS